jgi:hypothetical protein
LDESVKQSDLKHAKLTAFGSTRRKNLLAKDDPGILATLAANTQTVAIFGKTWDLHVTHVLNAELEQNLEMIYDTVKFFKDRGLFDKPFKKRDRIFNLFFLCQNNRNFLLPHNFLILVNPGYSGYFNNTKLTQVSFNFFLYGIVCNELNFQHPAYRHSQFLPELKI